MRCLVIDDDVSPRELIERLIRRSGHRVTAVGTDFAAVRAMATQKFDVAIVDMEMPGKGGPATIEALREYDPQLRVLVVSGYDDRRRVLAALDAGADGYIVKDEVHESLLSSLQSQDMFLAGSFLMFLALLTVVGMLISDILLGVLDPRIRLTGGQRCAYRGCAQPLQHRTTAHFSRGHFFTPLSNLAS